jgi:hypothetical protein
MTMDITEVYETLQKANAARDAAAVKTLSEYTRSVELSLTAQPGTDGAAKPQGEVALSHAVAHK